MEKMLRKKKNNSDYEIDRELTGKFAIEKNAEYQDRIAELEEENKKLRIENIKLKDRIITDENFEEKLDKENKKLKEENEYRKRMVDVVPEGEGHIAEETIQDLQARIKKLNEELKKYKKLHKYSNGELLTYSGD